MTTALDVIAGNARWSAEAGDALAWLRGLPTASVDLVFTSPPYEDARQYGPVRFRLRGQGWVDWMRPIIVEAARVSRGLVAVNAAGKVRDHKYSPAVEWLVADLTRLDGLVCGPSPYAWVRNGLPGSGSKWSGYHRRCWEPVYCFALPDRLPLRWHDHLAFGKRPRFGPGGEMSNRTEDGRRTNAQLSGRRVNQWGQPTGGGSGRSRKPDGSRQAAGRPSHYSPHGITPTSTRRKADGSMEAASWRAPTSAPDGDFTTRETTPPAIACPPNVIRTGNGGNQLGHELAHENEAPMNLELAERFACWFVPPGGLVCDPFCGSGTSLHAALIHGRRGVGCDLRQSQADLTSRRLATVQPGMF